ncbi:hypothetical protein H8S10_14365 [Clostridium sp. NSJ-49]|uniref:hypothetical protein n=1 Tax=Clostridium sp. NSJ-49 TaxID=2763034 RepID=UPI00164C7ED9|nr:hypothetical protein [Clostridium sp. NSJ-49]MBC5626633.1 hypothetical protein [Clostridium sp. NSJ-49]
MYNDLKVLFKETDEIYSKFKNNIDKYIEDLKLQIQKLTDKNNELIKENNRIKIEFEEYKQIYNKEKINEIVDERLKVLQDSNEKSVTLEKIRDYIKAEKTLKNKEIINVIGEVINSELNNPKSVAPDTTLLRDIFTYLYINDEDNIITEILSNSKKQIESSVLKLSNKESDSCFAIELIKYYLIFLNESDAALWIDTLVKEEILRESPQNERILVDLLYMSFVLKKDTGLLDDLKQFSIIIKERKYDYLWYELYNKIRYDNEKIKNKFPLLNLYYKEMNLIDYKLKDIIIKPIMNDLINNSEENNTDAEFVSHLEELCFSKKFLEAQKYINDNIRSLEINYSEVDSAKLLLLSALLNCKTLVLEKNSGIRKILEKINIENILSNLIENEDNVTEGKLLDSISAEYLNNNEKITILPHEFNEKLSYLLWDRVINKKNDIYKSKNISNGICPIHKKAMYKISGYIVGRDKDNNQKYLKSKIYYCDICKKYYSNTELLYKLPNTKFLINDLESNKNLKSNINKEVELNVQSELGKLGYSTAKSDIIRWKILKEEAIPKLGKKRVINHIEWLISFHKNKKNAVEKWKYDLENLKKLK